MYLIAGIHTQGVSVIWVVSMFPEKRGILSSRIHGLVDLAGEQHIRYAQNKSKKADEILKRHTDCVDSDDSLLFWQTLVVISGGSAEKKDTSRKIQRFTGIPQSVAKKIPARKT